VKLERNLARLAMATLVFMLMISLIPQQYETAAEFTTSQERTDLTGIKVAVYWGTTLD